MNSPITRRNPHLLQLDVADSFAVPPPRSSQNRVSANDVGWQLILLVARRHLDPIVDAK